MKSKGGPKEPWQIKSQRRAIAWAQAQKVLARSPKIVPEEQVSLCEPAAPVAKDLQNEDDFLRAILTFPRDDNLRLAFADWLEARGDPRGEFVRVTVVLEKLWEKEPPSRRGKLERVRMIARLQRRLRELRQMIPVNWELRLHRGGIDHCRGRAGCPGTWAKLQETNDPAVRYCSHCMRNVWFCRSASDVSNAVCSGHPVSKALAMDRAEPER